MKPLNQSPVRFNMVHATKSPPATPRASAFFVTMSIVLAGLFVWVLFHT